MPRNMSQTDLNKLLFVAVRDKRVMPPISQAAIKGELGC